MKRTSVLLLLFLLFTCCRLAEMEAAPVMKTMKDIEEALSSRGLSEYYEEISKTVRNSIRIELIPADDEDIHIGASKMGGLPDLPDDIEWFREESVNTPLSFICQINFAEVKPFDVENKLPDHGILYFFYNCSMYVVPWSYDPYDEDGWVVFYYDGDLSVLTRREAPGDIEQKGCVFSSACLGFENLLDLPDWYSGAANELTTVIKEEDQESYCELTGEGLGSISNKLLGHSDNIQNDMEAECEKETQRSGNWHLLLQIDSNENLGMMWGDVGRLYLWITDEDITARSFESVWVVMQCY